MYFLSIYCFETVTFVILYFSFIIVIQILKLLLSRKNVVILYFPSHRASLYTSVALQSLHLAILSDACRTSCAVRNYLVIKMPSLIFS